MNDFWRGWLAGVIGMLAGMIVGLYLVHLWGWI